jgi:DNA-binding response OmpR family regulator
LKQAAEMAKLISSCMTKPSEPTSLLVRMASFSFFRMSSGFNLKKFAGIFFCSWFIFEIGNSPLHGAIVPEKLKYEYPPPKIGSLKWSDMQASNQAQQELYRPRVPIPDAVDAEVPHLQDALNYNPPANPEEFAPRPIPPILNWLIKLPCYLAIFFLTGILLLKKFAPQILINLNQHYNPWLTASISELILSETTLKEAEVFAEFVTKFKTDAPAVIDDTPANLVRVTEFYKQAAERIEVLRGRLKEFVQTPEESVRKKILADLLTAMTQLKHDADFPELVPFWRMTCVLEGLLKQLTEKIRAATPSALRTFDGGIGLLTELCTATLPPQAFTERPLKFLVVDDDLLSRHALSLALSKAFSKPDVAEDGETALKQIRNQEYDVIFLDVEMEGMDGFELCTRIRETALNRTTPVVFVTGHEDFGARAKSTLSGGNDLMGKPFLIFEVTVKALTLATQTRLQTLTPTTPVADTPPAVTASPRMLSPTTTIIATTNPVTRPVAAMPDDLTKSFLVRAKNIIHQLKEICRKLPAAETNEEQQSLLAEGFLLINSLVSSDRDRIIHPAHQVSTALEALFRKLLEDPNHSSISTLGTITAAVGIIDELSEPGWRADLALNPPISILVVDDDLVSRRALTIALQTMFKRPITADSGETALKLADENSFDVIFLDVIMPEMDGFQTCAKIREMIQNRNTPILFVTSKNDAETKEEILLSGGDDLLGKPFLNAEITLKTLTFALRARINRINNY